MTRYIIIGAGAIGGGLGGRLVQQGSEVVLVARGQHLAALQSTGLRLRSPHDDEQLSVTAAGGPDDLTLTTDDVLVMATKTNQVQAALEQWVDVPVAGAALGATAGEVLPVFMALNGVESERIALRYFSRVYGVCVWMPSVHLQPGEVIIRSTPLSGVFHIGRVPVDPAYASDPLLAEVAGDWRAAGFHIELPADVMPWKYRKLINNLSNALQALSGPKGRARALVNAASEEARAVMAAAGIDVTPDEEEAAARAGRLDMQPVPGQPDEMGGSTWQSLARGTGNVETDYLNGEIVRIAHEHGMTAPINSKLASLVRIAAARGDRPGSITTAELATILGVTET